MHRSQGIQIYFNKSLIVGCLNYVFLENKPKVNENIKNRKKNINILEKQTKSIKYKQLKNLHMTL